MSSALHAEWTKLRTVSSTGWLLLGAVALTVALSAIVAAALRPSPEGAGLDLTRLSLTGVQLGQVMVAVLAVTVVGGEYGTGMIRGTFAAVPRRPIVVAAKAAVVAGSVLVAGTVAVLGSWFAGRMLLPGNGFTAAAGYVTPSLSDATTLRAVSGSVLYLALIALLSLGVAAALRDSAVALGVVLAVLYVFPLIAQVVSDPDWQRHLRQAGPTTAGLAVQATTGLDDLPIGPWHGLGVLALWAVGALAIGTLVVQTRDA